MHDVDGIKGYVITHGLYVAKANSRADCLDLNDGFLSSSNSSVIQ
jgi:hypothetical protein